MDVFLTTRPPAKAPKLSSPKLSADPVEQAFQAYVQAARQAQESLDIRDGIEAGRRWGAFVRLFEGAER